MPGWSLQDLSRGSPGTWAWLLLCTYVPGGSPAGAQEVIRIDSVAACRVCRIQIGTPIPLRGEFEDGSLVGTAAAVRRDPRGRFLAVYNGDRRQIHVHAPDGSFSGELLGGPGEGPGEFRTLTSISIRGNILHAYDPGLGRRTDFDLDSMSLIRTVPLPIHFESIVLEDGESVLGGAVRTREAAGNPLHVHDREGAWVRSFGLAEPVLRPDLTLMLNRTLAQSGNDRFWSATTNEYRLELWDTDGQLVRTVVAEREWFEPWTEYVTRSPDQPPSPNLTGIAVDREGLLWVLMNVAAESWADALADERDPMGNRELHPDVPYLIGILEVINPDEGELLASHRFPYVVYGFAGPGAVMRSWIDETFLPRTEVIPVSLVRR